MRKLSPYQYDANKAPKAKEWLKMDEEKRKHLIEKYHRKIKFQSDGYDLHILFHLIIENQAALRDQTPVAVALKRLQREGLNRHDAIHAIGSVLLKYWFEMSKEGKYQEEGAFNEAYMKEVRTLTAKDWFDQYGEP